MIKQEREVFDFLDIKEIKNNILILKDNSLRKILEVFGINIFLKPAEQQEAIFYHFQNFLNSLESSIQICVISRRMNIVPYLNMLEELKQKQEKDLLKLQIQEYQNFIANLVATGEIITKRFFVVVPFYFKGLEALKQMGSKKEEKIDPLEFERGKKQLQERADFVAFALEKCGVKVKQLNNKELTELFWSLYHSQDAEMGLMPSIPVEFS